MPDWRSKIDGQLDRRWSKGIFVLSAVATFRSLVRECRCMGLWARIRSLCQMDWRDRRPGQPRWPLRAVASTPPHLPFWASANWPHLSHPPHPKTQTWLTIFDLLRNMCRKRQSYAQSILPFAIRKGRTSLSPGWMQSMELDQGIRHKMTWSPLRLSQSQKSPLSTRSRAKRLEKRWRNGRSSTSPSKYCASPSPQKASRCKSGPALSIFLCWWSWKI